MNIVKIKDIAIQDLPQEVDAEIFALYKDKFCYCVNWNWLVLFEDITISEYVNFSQNCTDLSEILPNCVRYDFYLEHGLIDTIETDKYNSISKFIEFNKFSPSYEDLTLDQVKRFRTWLAETLYNILQDEESYKVLEMLNYYKCEMDDDTIKHLKTFSQNPAADILTQIDKTTCGCQKTTDLSTMTGISVCDPIYIYRKAVYENMVELFSDIYFWKNREIELLVEIKKYVDYIIAKGLVLTSDDFVTDLYDCGCLSDENSSQERLMGILKDFSKALGYLINGETGHNNFIGDTLNKWASLLYEKMRWE